MACVNKCVRCGQLYEHLQNLGEFECRYHPGSIAYDPNSLCPPGTYTCCKVSPHVDHPQYRGTAAALGCRRAHHRQQRTEESRGNRTADGQLFVPVDRASAYLTQEHLMAESVTYDQKKAAIVIRRHENPRDVIY